jgi:hypothetical protein
MKSSNIAAVAIGAAVMAALLAYPALATTASTNTSPTTASGAVAAAAAAASGSSPAVTPSPNAMNRGPGVFLAHGGPFGGGRGGGRSQTTTTFTNGQTITLTSTSGNYYVVGTQGKTNGTASGTLTFTVAGKLSAGYILNVGGNLVVAGTTYSVTSGSAVMGSGGAGIQGQGATSSSGSFIVRAQARGDFSGTTTAKVALDFINGTTEYAVLLTSTIAG